MDEIPIKFINKEPKSIAYFLKSLRKIEKTDEYEEWVTLNIKIPFFDSLYDFLIRLFIFFCLLVSFYYPLPKPISFSIILLFLKSISLSLAYGIVLKLKQELWRKT